MIFATLIGLLLVQAPGIAPDWDLKPQVDKIGPEVQRLRPLLDQLQPEKWLAAGAPAAYEKQYKDCLTNIGYVQNAAGRLAAQPAKLTLAVETLVRLETLIQLSTSVSQAVRRYQNPAVAELLESEISAAGASRDWLRQHVSDLSALREKELEVSEQEAQRCRAQTLKQGGKK
ncbi:MAG: hypothetical protein IPP47_19450 [Bryobacterales bacterium]|nr:hypothetical protein [Bryobacterales bacterium]